MLNMGALIGLPLFPFSGSIFEIHPPLIFAELRSVQKEVKLHFWRNIKDTLLHLIHYYHHPLLSDTYTATSNWKMAKLYIFQGKKEKKAKKDFFLP